MHVKCRGCGHNYQLGYSCITCRTHAVPTMPTSGKRPYGYDGWRGNEMDDVERVGDDNGVPIYRVTQR